MGVVYRAEDTKLQRAVALKFLGTSSLTDAAVKECFLREARAAATLDHPNICGVYEIAEDSGRLFMAMPLLEGLSLDKRIAQGPRPIEEILNVSIQTAEGLEEAHFKQIVHRDIKPGNIMVRERRGSRLQATLMDFGLARLSQATKLTREGSQLGTAAYMSPEQAQGDEGDQRTDVWALGVVMYEMVAGQLPFKAEYEHALFCGIFNEEPDPVTALRSGVPMELERIVHKCLAKTADERYQSMTDLIVDLNSLKKTSSDTSVRSRVQAPKPVATQPATSQTKEQKFSSMQLTTGAVGLAVLAAALTWAVTAVEPTQPLHSR